MAVSGMNHFTILTDDVPHTVVSGDKTFKSRALDTGEKFSYTFNKPGKYTYFCDAHAQMHGTFRVTS